MSVWTVDIKNYSQNHRLFIASAASLAVIALFTAFISNRSGGLRSDMLGGNYSSAYSRLLKASEAGDATAENAIGNMYYLGLGRDQDYKLAREWYFKAALKGNAAACVNAGHLYSQGLGVPKDIMRTYGWFVHAKKAGSKEADNYLREILGGFEVVPNMMQRSLELYPTVAALTK
ncbi:MAG: tetratricopeptide repeat protein [Hyphomicrobiales bacterium]|nr:tetratricopeptide repeat protein [Hyphomicrobiales bacterium]